MVSGSAALPEPVMKRWKEITGKYDPLEYRYFKITLKSKIPLSDKIYHSPCLVGGTRKNEELPMKNQTLNLKIPHPYSPLLCDRHFYNKLDHLSFTSKHQYAYSLYCSLHIFQGADKENLYNNQYFFSW